MAWNAYFHSRCGSCGSKKRKRTDSDDSDCSGDDRFSGIDDAGSPGAESGIDRAPLLETWVLKDFPQVLLAMEERRLHCKDKYICLGHFTHPVQPLTGVVFEFSLNAIKETDRSCHVTTLKHVAKFTDVCPGTGVQRCWTNVTAELVSTSAAGKTEDENQQSEKALEGSQDSGNAENPTLKEVDKSEPDFDVIATIKLGPNELVNDDERNSASCQAWPLDVLRAVINKDGSLRIRMTLQLCDIDRAIRSRDLICGLHGDGLFTSDFVIKVENEQFAVHKCILAAASSDFQSICSDESVSGVLDLTHIASPAGVNAFISLLYCDAYEWVALEDVVVTDALMLACRFKTEHVKDQLVVVIAKILCLENVLRILTAAIECDAQRAKEICFSFLLKNRVSVRRSDSLNSLLEFSPQKDQMRAEFVRVLFNRQFCGVGRPATASATRSGVNPGSRFPYGEIFVSETWLIPKAELNKVETTELRHTTRNYHDSNKQRTLQWQLTLHPRGRMKPLRCQRAALFTLNLSHRFGEYNVCWAYVSISIVNTKDEVRRPVVQDQLFEFSQKELAVETGLMAASLVQLSSNGNLCVQLDLRLVNINDVLAFNETHTRTINSAQGASVNQVAEIVDVETWSIAGARDWLAMSTAKVEYQFKFQHQKYPHTNWYASLSSLKSDARSIFSHFGKFGSGGGDIGHCWTHLTAELLLPPNKIAETEAFENVSLWPNELTRSLQSAVKREAWFQDVLQSAIHNDDTLKIRLTLKIYDVAEAIKSRDSLRVLRRHNAAGDFKLKAASATFPVHKSLLAAVSDEFRAKFGSSNDVIWDLTSLSVSSLAVRAFLALVYCDFYDWKSDKDVVSTILGILKLANEFKAEQIKDLMAAVVSKLLNKGNVLRILDATIANEAAKAREACCAFLLEQNRSAMENSECLRHLLEQSEEKGLARLALVRAFFEKSANDCYCRRMGCPSGQRVEPVDMPFGQNQQQIVSGTWLIQKADVELQKAKLSHEFEPTFEQAVSLTSVRGNGKIKKFKLRLYTNGRNPKATFEGVSSFSILPHPQGVSELESLMAYVGISLEKDGVTTFATDGDGQSKMLVEFTKSRGLLIDKAWPTAALRNAVRDDNRLRVRIELQIVDVRESLICHEMMRSIYEQRAFSDFTLACEGESIKVHKCVLAQRSQIFAAMLSSEMRESTQNCLDLTNATTVEGMRAFVSAIYFLDSSSANGEAVFELVKLAHQYGLPDITHEYDRKFAAHIDMENVLDVLSASKLYDLAYSQAVCMRYLRANTFEFLKSEAWLDLTKNESRSEVRDALMADLLLCIAS